MVLYTNKAVTLLDRADAYLQSTLGTSLTNVKPFETPMLPMFLVDTYALHIAMLFGRECLLVTPKPNAKITANTYDKHRNTFQDVAGSKHIILVADHLDTRVSRGLIGRHESFIVPDTQLYLPDFAIHFRERRGRPKSSGTHVSPTAQLIILAHLHGQEIAGKTASKLAPRYCLSIMSISRAIGELVDCELAAVEQRGRENVLRLPPPSHEYWTQACGFLRSPIRKIRRVAATTTSPPGLLAGESALAHYTSLVAPVSATFAIADHEWKFFEPKFGPQVEEPIVPGVMLIETWSYDPKALSAEPTVDRLSLWLAMHDHPDERVARAAEIALKEFSFEGPRQV